MTCQCKKKQQHNETQLQEFQHARNISLIAIKWNFYFEKQVWYSCKTDHNLPMKCSSKLTQLMMLKNNVKLNHGSMTLKNTSSQTKTSWFNDTQKHRLTETSWFNDSKTQAIKMKHHGSMTLKRTVKLKPGLNAHKVLGCHSQESTFSQSGWHRYWL